MAGKTILDKDKVLSAIEKHCGIVADIATQFKVSRQTVYNFINDNEDLKIAIADAREVLVDLAESALIKRINAGDTTAIIFTLKTQGKKRGYIERHEITGADGGAIPILVTGMNMDEL